jgi:CRP-like cAMP-binding protein
MPYPARNTLLQRLSPATRAILEPLLQPLTVWARQSVSLPGEPIDWLYFPEGAVASVIALDDSGLCVEAATVGYEGVVGVQAVMGAATSPLETVWQIPGQALRLSTATYVGLRPRITDLTESMLLYATHEMTQMAQSAACNRLHGLEERCARWLLQMHDRVSSAEFPLTHEYLGTMLGVHRPSVTLAVGSLAARALVAYRRGVMTIVDRTGLEAAACACYAIIRTDQERLFGDSTQVMASESA